MDVVSTHKTMSTSGNSYQSHLIGQKKCELIVTVARLSLPSLSAWQLDGTVQLARHTDWELSDSTVVLAMQGWWWLFVYRNTMEKQRWRDTVE